MLSSRINLIETALSAIASVGSGYIDLVNSFPAVALLRPTVARQHQGKQTILHIFTCVIRGYVLTDEDSINDSEDLARAIEQTLQSISSPLIDDVRVLTVETDEGLLSPYGMCDVQCQVTWYE
jgi:hypothetical protein